MKLSLAIEMPAPKMERKACPRPSVEDRVREALECIDSGYDSSVEWTLINSMYRKLRSLKRPNERAKNLIKMIEPVLSKFGYHSTDNLPHTSRKKKNTK